MSNNWAETVETLISLDGNDQSLSSLMLNLQGLYKYLQHNSSSRCKNDYIRLMAHFLENYLDPRKKLFLREYLGNMVACQTDNEYAAQYFKKRLSQADIFDLLKQHHNLTGKLLILTKIDYDQEKFKLKIC